MHKHDHRLIAYHVRSTSHAFFLSCRPKTKILHILKKHILSSGRELLRADDAVWWGQERVPVHHE